MKSNNEMQLIKPCEICIQDKELLEEIVGLNECVSWLDSEILDLEKEVARLNLVLKKNIYINVILKRSIDINLILKKSS